MEHYNHPSNDNLNQVNDGPDQTGALAAIVDPENIANNYQADEANYQPDDINQANCTGQTQAGYAADTSNNSYTFDSDNAYANDWNNKVNNARRDRERKNNERLKCVAAFIGGVAVVGAVTASMFVVNPGNIMGEVQSGLAVTADGGQSDETAASTTNEAVTIGSNSNNSTEPTASQGAATGKTPGANGAGDANSASGTNPQSNSPVSRSESRGTQNSQSAGNGVNGGDVSEQVPSNSDSSVETNNDSNAVHAPEARDSIDKQELLDSFKLNNLAEASSQDELDDMGRSLRPLIMGCDYQSFDSGVSSVDSGKMYGYVTATFPVQPGSGALADATMMAQFGAAVDNGQFMITLYPNNGGEWGFSYYADQIPSAEQAAQMVRDRVEGAKS